MSDRSTQLVLDALGRAAAEPAGLPLHSSKTTPGLFAPTPAGKQAAQMCKEEGLLQVVGSATRGKTTHEVCAVTEKGLAYLLNQVSPRTVLEQLVCAVEARQVQADELLAVARQVHEGLDALKATAEKVLHQVNRPTTNGHAGPGQSADTWPVVVLDFLRRWQSSGAPEDCSLPELYRQTASRLSIGQFHDGLRRLHECEQIYLHPWTGPLYDIPEPPYALLVGHEIAYYASLRK
jgi:hypothetical protein